MSKRIYFPGLIGVDGLWGAFKVQAFPRGICDPIPSSLSFLVYIQIAPLQRDAPPAALELFHG